LSYGVKRQVAPFAPFGLLAVFGVLYIQSVNAKFFELIYTIVGWFGVDQFFVQNGDFLFRFWQR
jgi:hypothetical protein